MRSEIRIKDYDTFTVCYLGELNPGEWTFSFGSEVFNCNTIQKIKLTPGKTYRVTLYPFGSNNKTAYPVYEIFRIFDVARQTNLLYESLAQ
jgi:hypothetical protein